MYLKIIRHAQIIETWPDVTNLKISSLLQELHQY